MAGDEYIRVTDDDYLEIRKKLTDQGPTSKGKATIWLNSHGFQPIPNTEGVSINLLVVRRNKKSEKKW